MISSGESMIEVAAKLKGLGANRIYVCTCFGLFCNGLDIFDEAYKNGTIERILTTNLIYRTPELLTRKWYTEVDMSKYIALLLDTINHDRRLVASGGRAARTGADRLSGLRLRKSKMYLRSMRTSFQR